MNTNAENIDHFDMVVVGAGIQGAGIAEHAAKMGLSVLLLERNSRVGSETSANSSKLIHGGLRYLETFQFSLVYECLSQRRFLLKNKPNLVSLKPFYIPVYRTSKRRSWWVFLGLLLYSVLGGLRVENRFRIVAKNQWADLGVKTNDLVCVFQYWDAQTDDHLLTESVCESAITLGAELQCECELLSAKQSPNGFLLTLSHQRQVSCSKLVNAAGPWVNEVAERVETAPRRKIDWVQGTHVVLDSPAIKVAGKEPCFYLESVVDGRAFFVLPWQGKVMIGTTEVELQNAKAQVTESEIKYLLDSFHEFFPEMVLSVDNIESTYCGIRVLPSSDDELNATKKSRETLFLKSGSSQCQYLAVYGGKLTSYRATAEKVYKSLYPKQS